jgi:MATE family multidrug resistance protein
VGYYFGNIVNVILNYLFIYGIWIFQSLLVGAAIGTIVSSFCYGRFLPHEEERKVSSLFEGFSLKKIEIN